MAELGKVVGDFDVVDAGGAAFGREHLLGHCTVVFFFPKAGTRVCTAEACSFQQDFPDLEGLEAQIVGVSPDSPARLKQFAETNGLTFRLVSDQEGRMASAFDVPKILGLLRARVTFVVDPDAVIRASFRNELNGLAHVEAAKLALQALRDNPPQSS